MTKSSTKKYAFVLGRERDLCLAELKAVLARFCFGFDLLSVTDNIAFINIEAESAKVANLAEILGGTVKIYEVISDQADIRLAMFDDIFKNFGDKGKITFGLSAYPAEHLNLTMRAINKIGFEVKKDLRKKGISSRFVELRESTEVPTILSLKEKLIGKGVEYGIFPHAFGFLIGLSNPIEWSERDYEKPAGDKQSGMLPPKLARIMINLALGQIEVSGIRYLVSGQPRNTKYVIPNTLVIDPFCGSGNLVLEAMMLGLDVLGSDNSEKAVTDSKKNVEWLVSKYQVSCIMYQVVQADATSKELIDSLNTNYLSHNTDIVIVTEPYLGEPKKYKPTLNAAKGEYAKVKELYLGFLRNFMLLKTLNLPMTLCVVFPLVETLEGKQFSLYLDCVDEIKKMGYIEVRQPLSYGRDYQVVKREIALLTLGN